MPLYGVASYQGVECDSGHRAAVGVTLDISGVGSPKRPNPEEFEEVVRKARAKLNNDEVWNGILNQLRQKDREDKFIAEARKWGGYMIPCPKCGTPNTIVWSGFVFAPNEHTGGWYGYYKCHTCDKAMPETDWKKNFECAIFPRETIPQEERQERMIIDPWFFLAQWQDMKREWPEMPDDNPHKKSYGKYRTEMYQYKNAVRSWKEKHICCSIPG